MQLSRSLAPVRNSDDNLIPLINVVFLMLVFFMVAGQILPSDAFKVEPPFSRVEKQAPREAILVLVDGSGRIALEGRELKLERLSAGLDTLLNGSHATVGSAPQRPVALKVDAALPARELNGVLDALRAAGAASVTLYTAQASEAGAS